jgi:hypothetical protein
METVAHPASRHVAPDVIVSRPLGFTTLAAATAFIAAR